MFWVLCSHMSASVCEFCFFPAAFCVCRVLRTRPGWTWGWPGPGSLWPQASAGCCPRRPPQRFRPGDLSVCRGPDSRPGLRHGFPGVEAPWPPGGARTPRAALYSLPSCCGHCPRLLSLSAAGSGLFQLRRLEGSWGFALEIIRETGVSVSGRLLKPPRPALFMHLPSLFFDIICVSSIFKFISIFKKFGVKIFLVASSLFDAPTLPGLSHLRCSAFHPAVFSLSLT